MKPSKPSPKLVSPTRLQDLGLEPLTSTLRGQVLNHCTTSFLYEITCQQKLITLSFNLLK